LKGLDFITKERQVFDFSSKKGYHIITFTGKENADEKGIVSVRFYFGFWMHIYQTRAK